MTLNLFKRTVETCLLGFLLLISCLPVNAEDLSEIYDRAVQNDPQLGAAKALYLSRGEVVKQAKAGILPFASVGGSTSDERRTLLVTPGITRTDNFNNHAWQAVLIQPIFRLDRWYQFQQSKNIKAQALAQFASDQQDLIVRVAESYLNILEKEDFLSASNAERNAVGRQLEQVQQRFDVGLVAITDVLESTAAFDASTVNVITAEGDQSTSFEPLLRLTGESINSVLGLSGEFPVKPPVPMDEDAWVQAALQQNYSLVAAREVVKAAEKQIKISKSGHLPTVDAQVTYTHSISGGGGFFGSEVDNRSVALQMNIPLYAGGGTRSAVKQSTYLLEEAQKTFDLTQRTVVEKTKIRYTAINTDVARVRARLRGIESSQSALDATQTGYEVGTRNIVDVLLAQQRLFLSQFQYASARYQYIKDTFRLKQLVGALSPDDIYDLNNFTQGETSISRITPTTR
ncbi:MAG: TolC family outer membrane protein [Gammaproteobacteria bacterium]|nr:TolC family outer membrane protein [Gammaproteobacteria bacterium]